jgi:hypothetical protein
MNTGKLTLQEAQLPQRLVFAPMTVSRLKPKLVSSSPRRGKRFVLYCGDTGPYIAKIDSRRRSWLLLNGRSAKPTIAHFAVEYGLLLAFPNLVLRSRERLEAFYGYERVVPAQRCERRTPGSEGQTCSPRLCPVDQGPDRAGWAS